LYQPAGLISIRFHALASPCGWVLTHSCPSLAPTQNEADTHEIASNAMPGIRVLRHAERPPVGSLEVRTVSYGAPESTAIAQNDRDGHDTADKL
jgi:hypothetical protein